MRLGRILFTVAVLLALPQGAQAFVIGGRAWPAHRIPYFNADKRLAREVKLAAEAWNTSGARVRFVAVRRSRARVIVRQHAIPTGIAAQLYTCQGFANIGYSGGTEYVDLTPPCTDRVLETAIITHELGHILGLTHVAKGCATMTPAVWAYCARPRNDWQFRCRFALTDDVRGAVRLYGGRVRKKRTFCDSFAPPGAATDVSVTPDGTHVSWRTPAAPRPLFGLIKPELEASVQLVKDSCANLANGTFAADTRAVPGKVQTATVDPYVRITPGTWCFAVQVNDQFGRAGPITTTLLTIPNKPPVASFSYAANPESNDPGYQYCFDFTDTSSDDGTISAWRWDFGNGDNSDLRNSAYCYADSGTYTVTLTVTDDGGASATTSRQVTVTVPPGGTGGGP